MEISGKDNIQFDIDAWKNNVLPFDIPKAQAFFPVQLTDKNGNSITYVNSCAEEPSSDAAENAHRLFAAAVEQNDISTDILKFFPCADIIKRIITKRPEIVSSMFYDAGDGTVVVRFFEKQNGEFNPVYVRIDPEFVYNQWIATKKAARLWAAILVVAFCYSGIDILDNDREIFAASCCGDTVKPDSF